MTTAYVAFGANLGAPHKTFEAVAAELRALPMVQGVRTSQLYSTSPVGGPADQPIYTNGAYEIAVDGMSAKELYASIASLEKSHGRQRLEHWGPRTIDLDLILFGNEIVELPHLSVPHPRMHFRSFVLRPLLDLNPSAIHPLLGRSIASLWDLITCESPILLIVDGNTEFLNAVREKTIPSKGPKTFSIVEATERPLAYRTIGNIVVGMEYSEQDANALSLPIERTWVIVAGNRDLTEVCGSAEVLSGAQPTGSNPTMQVFPYVDCRADSITAQIEKLEHFFASMDAL